MGCLHMSEKGGGRQGSQRKRRGEQERDGGGERANWGGGRRERTQKQVIFRFLLSILFWSVIFGVHC